jgi:hypothetical protein
MIWLRFEGWFQCRLATDPDPTDEPRGVSGYVCAVAGEPDLDRIIRFQPPTVQRTHCPQIGVFVTEVYSNGAMAAEHPLNGAVVNLLKNAKFEGRNGVVAEAGFEPIVPFHLSITKDSFELSRPHLDIEQFPFTELKASGINASPGEIAEATGIWDIKNTWRQRLLQLQADLAATKDPTTQAALNKRLKTLSNPGLTRFFGARMQYAFSLQGTPSFRDSAGWLGGPPDTKANWPIEFWFGAWDPDALSGFIRGFLGVPFAQTRAKDSLSARELSELTSMPSVERRA